jgi:hypothetical protein
MVNKLEKGRTTHKLAPQHQMKLTHHKKEERANFDEKIEYARSVFLNARRPHIKKWHWLQKWWQAQFEGELKWQRVYQVHQGKLLSRQEAKPQKH